MRKHGRILTLVLTFTLIFSMSSNVLAAKFGDTSNHWATKYVDWATDAKIVEGYPDGTFKPEGQITKAEFYKMINKMAKYTEKSTVSYTDVRTVDWFYDEVAKGVRAGYLSNSATSLNPNSVMTRDEACRILAYIYGLKDDSSAINIFTDAGSILNKGSVGALVNKKIINGYPDKTFRPLGTLKRAELAKMTYTAVHNLGLPTLYKSVVPPTQKNCPYPTEWAALQNAVKDGEATLTKQSYYNPTQGEVTELRNAVNAAKNMLNGYNYYGYNYNYYGYDYNYYDYDYNYYDYDYNYYGYNYKNIVNRAYRDFDDFRYTNRNFFATENDALTFWGYYSTYGDDGYYRLNNYTTSSYNPSYPSGTFGNYTDFYNYYKGLYTDSQILSMWNNGNYNRYTGYYNRYAGNCPYTKTDILNATNRIRVAIRNFTDGYTPYYHYYTVSFNSNGGTGVSSQRIPEGGTVSMPTAPTKLNHTFDGWYTDAALTTAYNFNAPVYSSFTLYAKWTSNVATFAVDFNSNGGTAVATQNIINGGTVTEPTAPTKLHHTFDGWYTDAALTNKYDFTTNVTSSFTLYAGWTLDAGYFTVDFNSNGGTAVASETVADGSTVTEPTEPTKLHHTFNGWYTDAELTNKYDFTTNVTSSFTLYAKWTLDAGYFTVDFNSNGGTAVASETVADGSTVTEPTKPEKAGHTFNGWYTDAALTAKYDFTTPVTSSFTLYAGWTADVENFTVTFESNGGTAVATQTIINGGTVTEPTEPTKAGHTFNGWYTNAALTAKYDFTTPVTSSFTLYAGWTADVENFTVTFNSNGGTPVASETVADGTTVTEPAEPTKTGYTFNGWYTNAELNNKYYFTTPVTSSFTLYAGWNAE